MALEGVTWIVVGNGLAQLAGLTLIVWMGRDLHRMPRVFEDLIYQQEGKTLQELEELGARLLGECR